MQVFAIPSIAPEMAAGLKTSEALVGALLMLVFLAGLVSSVFGGFVVTQIGPVRTSQLSMVLGAVGLGLGAMPNLSFVALGTCFLGASYGLVNPSTGQMLQTAITSHRRGLLFSVKQSAVPLGGILAGVVAPPLALALGWQGALLAIGASSLFGAAVLHATRHWFPFDRSAVDTKRPRTFGDLELIWKILPLRYVCLAAGAFSGVQFMLTTYMVTVLVHHVGIGLVVAGIGLSLFSAGGIVGRFCWGHAADVVGSGVRVLLPVYCVVLVLVTIFPLIGANWSVPLIYAFLLVLGSVAAGWNGAFIGEVLRLSPPGDSARTIGGGMVLPFAGGLVGVGLFALCYRLLGDSGRASWSIGAYALVGCYFSWKALVTVRRQEA